MVAADTELIQENDCGFRLIAQPNCSIHTPSGSFPRLFAIRALPLLYRLLSRSTLNTKNRSPALINPVPHYAEEWEETEPQRQLFKATTQAGCLGQAPEQPASCGGVSTACIRSFGVQLHVPGLRLSLLLTMQANRGSCPEVFTRRLD